MKVKNLELAENKDRNLTRKILLAIFVFTFLLYGNSLKNNYSIDDEYVTITNQYKSGNARVANGIKGIPKLFKTRYVESAQQNFDYRPLPLATFAIEYQFFGSNPHVSHFINVLLYALTCMLLFTVLRKLFKEYHIVFPLITTVFFMVHPIHTEVVNNIKCRDELLVFLFGLCATHFFIKNMDVGGKSTKYIILSVLCLMLALFCKRTSILFFVFIPITSWFFYPIQIKKHIPALVVIVTAFVLFWLLKNSMLHDVVKIQKREFAFFENPLYYDKHFLFKLLMSIYTCGYYLKLLLMPYPLSCYYGYNTLPAAWSSPLVWLALLVYAATGIYALIKLKQKSMLSYILLVFLLGVLPFSNFLAPAPGIVADRFIYFGSLGFCMLLVYTLFFLFKIDVKNKTKVVIKNKAKIVVMILMVTCTGCTVSRNTNWKDELTLFRNDIEHFQNSCNLHYMLGNKLYDKVYTTSNNAEKDELINECKLHYKQASNFMQESLQKYPNDYTSLNNVGMIYMKIFDDASTAWPYFKKAISLNPNEIMIQFNLAFCYEKRNLPDSAILFYEKAIAANTSYVNVYLNLHELYMKKQAFTKAIACDRKSVVQIPNYTKLYINLGNALLLNKDTLNAATQFVNGINCGPANAELKAKMKAFLISLKQTKKANMLK